MNKLLEILSILVIIFGLLFILVGIYGIILTYKNVTREKIVTPEDSYIPNKSVRGPLTLKAQVDIIRDHTLKITDNKTYAEMPRRVEKIDDNHEIVLGKDNKPVLVDNTARDIWVTATTLMTALNLGILAYISSGIIISIGCLYVLTGTIIKILIDRM